MAQEGSVAGRLDVREIVAVDAVARMRSFKLAAEQTHTTQPTLSRLIASAERVLGTTLFRRGWAGAETTPRGDVAARVCRLILAAIDEVDRELFADRKGVPPLRLNLKAVHLEAIAAVTSEGSVTLAARRLGRTQPDVSRTLSEVTQRFGIELFQRTATGMAALAPAQTLTALSRTVAYLLDRLPEQLRQLEGEVLGRVAVGMLPFSGQDLISGAFARLTNLYPRVRLSCVPGSYNGLVEGLRRHEIDRVIGILRGRDCPKGIEEMQLYDERFAVVARRDHPLQGAGTSLADLATTNWVVAPHGTPVRTHFEAVFAAKGLTPPTQTCEILSFSTAEQMLVESLSAAMLTYSERKLRELRPELSEVSTPFPPGLAPIGSMKLRDADDDAALYAFDHILSCLVAERA